MEDMDRTWIRLTKKKNENISGLLYTHMALSNSAYAHLAIVLSIVTDSYVLLSAQAYLLLRYLPYRLPWKHAEGSEFPQHNHAAKYNFNQICSPGDPTEMVSAQKCDINVKLHEEEWRIVSR